MAVLETMTTAKGWQNRAREYPACGIFLAVFSGRSRDHLGFVASPSC